MRSRAAALLGAGLLAPALALAWAQRHGVSELAVPRRVLVVDAIPVLGTGKTDYVAA